MSTRVSSARLIGRRAELSELEAALADAAAGRPSIAFVAGESGVGKSRLLTELERRALARGARVIGGECVELGEGELPYAPIVAALRPLARGQDPILAALAPAQRSALARLLPALGDGAQAGPLPDDATAQGQVFEALLSLLEALSLQAPVVLSIEDLHWADRSTRAFVAFLSRTLCRERVLVIATYRSDELHRRHPLRPLLAELERDARARRVELAPFTRAELADQLADILGGPPGEGLAERLWARGGGNALFTEELLAAGLDGRGAAPSTLRDALMVRVERLGEPAQELLRVLAAGQRLDHALLAEAAGLEPSALRDALREAVAGHIVVADAEGAYAFRHALLREVVHDDLLPGEHAELHARLAAALERRIAADGERAGAHLTASAAHHHFAAGDRPAALAASVRAAGAAEQVHAHGEALALLERALELWPSVPDAADRAGTTRSDLLARAARAAEKQGDAVRQEALAAAALRELDPAAGPHRRAALMRLLARAQRRLGRWEESLETIRHALGLLPEGEESPERARLLSLSAKVRMLHGRFHDGARLAREALAAARAADDSVAQGRALNALGVCLAGIGEVDAGIAALREALAVAERDDRPSDMSDAYTNLADTLFVTGRDEEALEVARAGLRQPGMSRHAGEWLATTVAEIAFERGDWALAREQLPSAERRRAGHAAMNVNLRRAHLELGRGDAAAARDLLLSVADMVESSGESQFHGPFGAVMAGAQRRLGDLAAARAAVDTALECVELCSDDGMRLAQVAAEGVSVEADAAQAADDLGDLEALVAAQDRAASLFERVEAAAAGGGPVERARLAGARAELARASARPDPALSAAAADAWAGLGRPYPGAIMRWREAEAHVAAGDREAAAVAARAALEAAERLGADWLAAEVSGLAARARLVFEGDGDGDGEGGRAPADADDAPFGLTPRERQVLALVARGATNREIGAELYMAEKTASVHVSRILAKLDVRTRTQAAAVAHRHGLDATPVA